MSTFRQRVQKTEGLIRGSTCSEDSKGTSRASRGVGQAKKDARVLGGEVLVVAAIAGRLEAAQAQRAGQQGC